jgi:hypothetical protein
LYGISVNAISLEVFLMGISIYYDAKRSYKLTEDENKQIENIVEKYNREKNSKKGKIFIFMIII